MKKYCYLITGGTGYLGYNYIKYLAERDNTIIALVRPSSDSIKLSQLGCIIEVVQDDLDTLFKRIYSNYDINFTIHFASIRNREATLKEASIFLEFTRILMKSVFYSSSHLGFINIGSFWQLTSDNSGLYRDTKIAQDEIISELSIKLSIKAICLILMDTYGPADWRDKLIPSVIEAHNTDTPYTINKPNGTLWLTFISDLNSAITHSCNLIIDQKKHYQRYLIKVTESVTVMELIVFLKNNYLSGLRVNIVAETNSQFENSSIINNPSYCKLLPKWNPIVRLIQGLSIIMNNDLEE